MTPRVRTISTRDLRQRRPKAEAPSANAMDSADSSRVTPAPFNNQGRCCQTTSSRTGNLAWTRPQNDARGELGVMEPLAELGEAVRQRLFEPSQPQPLAIRIEHQ